MTARFGFFRETSLINDKDQLTTLLAGVTSYSK